MPFICGVLVSLGSPSETINCHVIPSGKMFYECDRACPYGRAFILTKKPCACEHEMTITMGIGKILLTKGTSAPRNGSCNWCHELTRLVDRSQGRWSGSEGELVHLSKIDPLERYIAIPSSLSQLTRTMRYHLCQRWKTTYH